MSALIKVRRSRRRPIFTGGTDRRYTGEPAWSVWVAGLRIPGMYVVDGGPGLTLIRDGRMVTCWHSGIAPGDLARRYYPED